jgi:hypothetical protein
LISSPHRKVTERLGDARPARTSAASARAISACAPTPDALSLAPGSCTCALNTNRSSGLASPRTSATSVSSSARQARALACTRTRTGPAASASRSARRAAWLSSSPQARRALSCGTLPNWMEVTCTSGFRYAGSE